MELKESKAIKYIAVQHPAYYIAFPGGIQGHIATGKRPKVVAYIRKETVEFCTEKYNDLDFQVIKIYGLETFYVVNIYNERRKGV